MHIGVGYDSAAKKETELKIFSNSLKTYSKEIDKIKISSVEYMSSEQNKKDLSAAFGVEGGISTSICLKTALSISNDLITNQDSEVYILHLVAQERHETAEFDEQLFDSDKLFKNAKKTLEDEPDSFWQQYGDSYVSDIYYGKEMVIVISKKKNSAKRSSGLGAKAEVSALSTASIDGTIKFLKSLQTKNSECEIFIESVGFLLDQLPIRSIDAVAEWLGRSSNFKRSNGAADIISYEVKSYANIFRESMSILDNVMSRWNYYFAHKSLIPVLEQYIKIYEQWLEEPDIADEYRKMIEQANRASEYFSLNLDSADALNAYKKFKEIIDKSNRDRKNVPYRLINTVSSSDFHIDFPGKLSCKDKRISPSFSIPFVPGVEVDSFCCVVKSDAVLNGVLSFEYSSDRAVAYNDATHNITKNLNVDSSVRNIKIPTDVKDKEIIKHLAYHWEPKSSWWPACAACPPIEKFVIETYVKCKVPPSIENLPTINPRIKSYLSDSQNSRKSSTHGNDDGVGVGVGLDATPASKSLSSGKGTPITSLYGAKKRQNNSSKLEKTMQFMPEKFDLDRSPDDDQFELDKFPKPVLLSPLSLEASDKNKFEQHKRKMLRYRTSDNSSGKPANRLRSMST